MYAFNPQQPAPDASTRDLIAFARATAEVGERVERADTRKPRHARMAAGAFGFLAAVIALKAAG